MAPGSVHIRTIDGDELTLGIEHGTFVDSDTDTPELDLRHLVATSGLADSHAHIGATSVGEMVAGEVEARSIMDTNLAAQLNGGVLLVADKGTRDPSTLQAMMIDEAQRPELHMAGRIISSPGGYYEGFAVEVDGPDLPAAVEKACLAPATWVKLVGDWPRRGVGVMPNYAEDELRSAVDVAHANGCRVAIHTAAPDAPSMAVNAGVDSIEHGLFLTESDLKLLGARAGAWVPTVVAMEGLAAELREGSSGRRMIHDGLANVASIIDGATEAGVFVLAGTDLTIPHGEVATEVMGLHRFGLSIADALASATGRASDYLGSPRRLGALSPADLVCFAADPLSNLEALAKPAFIMRRGQIIHR